MALYTETASRAVLWPEPMEGSWQRLPRGQFTPIAPRLPHLSLADVLFIGAVVSIPGHRRPWGSITWLADVFRISRVSVYALGDRIKQRMEGQTTTAELPAPAAKPAVEQTVTVTPNRLARTILTATFPGNASIRPMQAILEEALGQRAAIGKISQLQLAAGRQAGEVLAGMDTSAMGPLIVIRDETFFQGHPILMVVDPSSLAILTAQVAPDRQAETWGLALLMAEEGGAEIVGLVEDMAQFYAKSQELVAKDHLPVQKDPWHLLRDGGKIRLYLERQAYQAMQAVVRLEKRLLKAWDDALFENQYVPAVAQEEQRIAQHDAFETWLAHLADAFEVVDRRSGEIRDPETAAWLLEETIAALAQIDQDRVQRFVKTLRNHQAQLLTFLHWTARALADYRPALAEAFPEPSAQRHFERTVARHWRLQQALINGHPQWRQEAFRVQTELSVCIGTDPTRQLLADRLLHILNGAGHTSSLVECINGLLKSFLKNRQDFRSASTLQAYLNLFTLWHNMRVFERGKRQGFSPYQLAGVDTATLDWLELLGYPKN